MKEINEYDTTYYSSFLFLLNVCIGIYIKDLTYTLLFFCLFLTSVLYRTYNNNYYLLADKLAIYAIVLYGSYILYKKYTTIPLYIYYCILTTFVLTIVLYHYGYYTYQFCFDTDAKTGYFYYSFLHCISSIGHTLIMLS